MIIYYYF